jgi:hypothetical protein
MGNAERGIAEIVGGLGGAVLVARFGLAEIMFPLTPALSPRERENVWLRFWGAGGARKLGGRDARGTRRRGRPRHIRRKELEEMGGVIKKEPVAMAALFPFGKVLFGDRAVFEVGGDDGFDFGERVKPGENRLLGLVIMETKVELFADGVREAGDFAVASCRVHNILF